MQRARLLPALGFAMTINVIGRPQFLPFFLGGFFFAQYSGIGGIPLALAGLFVAFLYYLILQASDNAGRPARWTTGSTGRRRGRRAEGRQLL